MKIKKQIAVSFLFLFSGLFLNAQVKRQYTNNTNGWFMYVGNHKLSDKWGLHLEAQWRRNEIILHNQQLLLRAGVNYHLNAQVALTAGYCYVITYPYGGLAAKAMFPENRIWEQLNMKTGIGAVEIINRFRLEQRYVNGPVLRDGSYVPGDAVYTNRVRWLNRYSVPFKGKTIEDRSVYFSFYNEIYINFGKNVGYNIFDQNRAYLALGYKIPKLGRLEIGYLNQLIFRPDGIRVEQNHTLQVGLSSNFEFRKKEK
jgi:hypothetical protein